MEALWATERFEYRYNTVHATYVSMSPVELRANGLTILDLIICQLYPQL
jgi:hypothetical protein